MLTECHFEVWLLAVYQIFAYKWTLKYTNAVFLELTLNQKQAKPDRIDR